MSPRNPVRLGLLAVLIACAGLAFSAPAGAAQCPWIPEWCSCGYCFKNQDCGCRLREGDSNYPCTSYLMYGGCGGLGGLQADEDRTAMGTEEDVREGDEVRLEDLLRASEEPAMTATEACE